jgi:hypothetical protein
LTRLITAPAEMPPLEFLSAVTGRPIRNRDRALEAAYLEAINAHWRAAKAASDAILRREGETVIAFLIRKLAPLYDHDDFVREQARLWTRGLWAAPEADRQAA